MNMTPIRDPRILPGEALYALPNGQVRLIARNGTANDFTVSEWEDYITEYNENLSLVDRIDFLLDSLRGRDIVPTSEVIDSLLDMRVRAQEDYEARKRVVVDYLHAIGVS